jgi:hypothetical protein
VSKIFHIACLAAALAGTGSAGADDRAEYNQRAAKRDLALFASLDRDADGAVTRDEAQGDLTLGPRLVDADIDRDGRVTRAEIERYVAGRYGTAPALAASR